MNQAILNLFGMNIQTPENALSKAIELVGGPGGMARLFGITPQAISQWSIAPAGRVLVIEKEVGCAVTRHDLRPDIFGEPQSAA